MADCSFIDCPNEAKAKGYCGGHYAQQHNGRPLTPLRGWIRAGGVGECRMPDCAAPARAQKLCRAHGASSANRAKHVNRWGYVLVYWPDHPNASRAGHVSEHTAVMADALGRPLLPGEEVHHRNGDRADNRLKNLELWTTSQPAGGRVEDKLSWALSLLRQYAPELLREV